MKPLILISMILTYMLMKLTHPMFMVMIISTQSLIICLVMSIMLQSAWLSFILFLVFMGGLMVLFIYISSLASNEEFETLKTMDYTKVYMIFTLILSVLLIMLNKPATKIYNLNVKEMIFKMYSTEMMGIISMTMSYLLLVLIIIVSIILMKEGPLRPMR